MPNNKPVNASPYEALISSILEDECVSYDIHFEHLSPYNVYYMSWSWSCDCDLTLAGALARENAKTVVSYDDARNFKDIMAKALANKKVIIERRDIISGQSKGEQPQLSADASWTILNIDAATRMEYRAWVREEGIFFTIDGSRVVMLRDEHEAILGEIYYGIQRDAIDYMKRNISSAEENLAAARHEMQKAEDTLDYYKSLARSLSPELRLMLEVY